MGTSKTRVVTVDCSGVRTTPEFWQRYLDAAQPEGAEQFGCNLDAFWDAIQGGGPGWPGEVELVFEHSDVLANLSTAGGDSFLAGLQEIAADATYVSVRLI